MSAYAQRSFCASSSYRQPPSPEPAISQSLNTPPNPIPPPGKIKGSSSIQQSAFATEKEEACSALSPSSPSAPRSQSNSAVEKSKAKETQYSDSSTITTEAPKAVIPEIINKPSVGRKGGGKSFIAQKAALTLSPTALERLRALQESSGGPKLIRIGVRNKGCAGMSYHLEYVTPDQAGKFDERVKQDGVEVLIDSKALFSIIGSEMDWQEDLLSAKFVFHNPNVVEACGCGESVRFG